MRLSISSALLILLAMAPAAQAVGPASDAGTIPFQELDLFPRDKLSVEIDLEGPLLHMVSEFTKSDDPDFAKLMAGLKAIHVQVYPLKDKAGAEPLRGKVDRTVHWLEDHGWHSTVRVRDKGQETYIYLKEANGRIAGLAVLSIEPGQEAALINIVGALDPAQIGRIGRSLDIPQLQKAQPRSGGKHEP
jgi:Domain of unknown function (DUF4252)